MRILWINNIAIPKIAQSVGMPSVPVGGWMVKLADELSSKEGIELGIAFPYEKNVEGSVDCLQYYGFSINEAKVKIGDLGGQDVRMEEIIRKFSPDIVHIFGTEYLQSYVVAEVCKKMGIAHRVVISIQGLTSVYARHYYGHLGFKAVHGFTLRDLYKGNTYAERKQFAKSGTFEVEALKISKHVIGRTDWDKACTEMINPAAEYHFNNEMLRDAFYQAPSWEFKNCEKHSIFLSQASSPIKGLHLALEAALLLKKEYPDLKVYIAGKSYFQKKIWKLSFYEKYILKYIKEHHLEETVEFLGFLTEEEMCKRYLKSHVFVSASSIENSPNSLCEAMILGVPVVSSLVGGVSNLMEHGKDGFYYQADAPYMLAHYVKKIFDDERIAEGFSENSRRTAQERHCVEKIVTDLCGIYERISCEKVNG